MRRFLLKTVVLATPFVILLGFTFLNYETEKGDLIRVGYIPNSFSEYRNKFEAELTREIKFDKLSDLPNRNVYDILTIGDSFSEQGSAGYQNYLSTIYGKSVLHLDRSFHNNQIQVLISLKNGGFFEDFNIKNVILQGVERHFIEKSLNLKIDSTLSLSSLKPIFIKESESQSLNYISNVIFKFPFYSIYRNLYPEELISNVYARRLKNKSFSVPDKIVYFYHLDITNIELNNSMDKFKKLNVVLNNLNKDLKNIGVNLIILPAPDKYHFYKDNLVKQSEFGNMFFFDHFSKLDKEYAFLDLMEIKKTENLNSFDFYYYDDSHWSPLGSKFVADKLIELIAD